MFNWLPDDTPKVEHKKFSPSCKEVKSWPDVIVADDDRAINRAEQTRFRSKIAKKLTGAFHRKHDSKPIESSPSKEAIHPQATDASTNDDQKLADIRRQREIAEKSLDGLEKLASFYPVGSMEQRRAEQSIIVQLADLEKLREEEGRMIASMGSLSFGRVWHDVSDSPAHQYTTSHASSSEPSYADESPEVDRAHGQLRALPQLPSQLRDAAVPRMPTKIHRTQMDSPIMPAASSQTTDELPTYEQYQGSETSSKDAIESEWVEYSTEDGTPYYYSTITKMTVWEIPARSSAQPVA